MQSDSYVYRGEASNYHEWEFLTRLRTQGKTDDAYIEETLKIIGSLQGDALTIAQGLDSEELWRWPTKEKMGKNANLTRPRTSISGIEKLITAMRAMVLPTTSLEVEEVFRHYCRASGTLRRQNGESMVQYVSRRQRCWNLLCELDKKKETILSENHRAVLLLDSSGLDVHQKMAILASIGDSRDFQKVADALMTQHPWIHDAECRRRAELRIQVVENSSESYRAEKSVADKQRSASRSRHLCQSQSYFDSRTPSGPSSSQAYEEDEDGERHDEEDFAEWLDKVASAVCFEGRPEGIQRAANEPEVAEAEVIQESRRRPSSAGPTIGRRHMRVTRRGRRRKPEEFKKRFSCLNCGRRGHWRGDPSCPAAKGKGASNSKTRRQQVSQVRLTVAREEADDFTLIESDTEDEAEIARTANMAMRSSSSRRVTFQSIAREAATGYAEEWTEVDAPSLNPKFNTGTFRGKFFLDVVREFPQHYFQIARTKQKMIPKENAEFKEWVEQHFEIDGNTLRRKVPSICCRTDAGFDDRSIFPA